MKDIHGANRLNGYQPVKWRARLAHATQPVTKRRLSLAVIICRPKNTLPKNIFFRIESYDSGYTWTEPERQVLRPNNDAVTTHSPPHLTSDEY